VSSPITFSGANGIDFNQILSIIMTQESQPLVALQNRQAALQSKAATFGTLTTRALAVQQAAAKLAETSQLSGYTATSSNTSASRFGHVRGDSGRYDVVVERARQTQVTASRPPRPIPIRSSPRAAPSRSAA
jgi:flagellar capping protein FliD